MIAGYLRVSSKSQGFSTQRAAIARAAEARGERIDRWLSEKVGGGKIDRPVLAELRQLVRAGEIRKLYVFRLDRLTRSGIRDTLELVEELKRSGCQLQTIADGLDFEGPGAEMVIAALSWAAKLERQKINENISAARERIKRQGGRWGRPPRVSAGLVTRIELARVNGDTIRAIAVRFKVPRGTVANILSKKGAYAELDRPSKKKPLKKR